VQYAAANKPLRVSIQKQRDHHAGVIGRKTALIIVARHNGCQIQLVSDQVTNEVSDVIGRDENRAATGQRPVLVDVSAPEGLVHLKIESRFEEKSNLNTRTGS
jgi:hypothetical protein